MIRRDDLIVMAGFLAITGCEPPSTAPTPAQVTTEDVERDTGKAVDTIVEFSQQSKDEFQQKLEARLKVLDAEIVELQEKGSDLKDDAKVKWDQKLTDLKAKRDTARTKLAEVTASSGEAWKDIKQGAQAAWEDMDKAFREASREF